MPLPAAGASGGAELLSLDALVKLEVALGVFSGKAAQALASMRQDSRQRRSVLDSREEDARREVSDCLDALEAADDDYERDSCLRSLAEAKARLREIRTWQIRVDEAQSLFLAEAADCDRLIHETLPHSRAYLQTKIEDLRVYHNLELGVIGAQPLRTLPTPSPVQPLPSESPERGALQRLTDIRLPRGFVWVPLSSIDSAQLTGVKPDTDYRKVPYETMREGLRRLRTEVLPRVHIEPDTTDRDTFSDMDHAAAQDFEHGLQRVYEAFFGDDFIYLERRQGQARYEIVNGRHRIRAASDLGWDAIPAQVKDLNS